MSENRKRHSFPLNFVLLELQFRVWNNILKAYVLLFPLKRVVSTPRNSRRLLNQSVLKYSNDPANRVQPNLLSVKMILRLSTLYRRHHQFNYQRSISPVSLRNQRLDLFYRVFRFLSPIAVFLARLTKTVRFILYRKTPIKLKNSGFYFLESVSSRRCFRYSTMQTPSRIFGG